MQLSHEDAAAGADVDAAAEHVGCELGRHAHRLLVARHATPVVEVVVAFEDGCPRRRPRITSFLSLTLAHPCLTLTHVIDHELSPSLRRAAVGEGTNVRPRGRG